MGRCLPCLSRDATSGAYVERRPSAPADLQQLGRAMAPLWRPSAALARSIGDRSGELRVGPSTVTTDIERILARAQAFHQAGHLNEAEGLYRQILAVDPNHADAMHLLGVVAYQGGRNDLALELIGKAIAHNDGVADFHCNIGNVLGTLGRLREAEAHYRQAIGLRPDHVESHNNLGN